MKYEPAFPQPLIRQLMESGERGGMTMRDYFAAKAMQAIVHEAEQFWEGAATLAYQYADAMLKARKE